MLPTIENIISNLPSIAPGFSIEKSPIGKGGQKLVYKLSNNSTGEFRVFKILEQDSNSIERLRREILAVKLLDHPNVPKVYSSNIDNLSSPDTPIWIVEEFISGKSLREVLDTQNTFSLDNLITFFDTMLSVLEKSESLKIVHRDIKPENIMLDDSNKFWLIDFGISRHLNLESITATNSPFGPCTFGYSAAEQFRNRKKEIDVRADLFSLGVVSAEMVLGRNPYLENTNSVLELIKKIEQQPLPLLRISGDSQFLLAKYIKNLGDNRVSRRPRSISEAKLIFELVKSSF